MKRLAKFLFLIVATGCHIESEEVSADYMSYQFDPQVIDKIPLYDSLVSAISENYFCFLQHINEEDSYRAYRYRPLSDQTDVFKQLPKEASPKIERYYTKLGKDFIYGFDVFTDSTIKIYIRNNLADNSNVTIDEILSYYPLSRSIKKREFPLKDTILNIHWQYWSRFTKRGIIF